MGQGVAIVDDDGAWDEDHGPTICKVCDDPIVDAGEVRVCASCKTPCHTAIAGNTWGLLDSMGANGKDWLRE